MPSPNHHDHCSIDRLVGRLLDWLLRELVPVNSVPVEGPEIHRARSGPRRPCSVCTCLNREAKANFVQKAVLSLLRTQSCSKEACNPNTLHQTLTAPIHQHPRNAGDLASLHPFFVGQALEPRPILGRRKATSNPSRQPGPSEASHVSTGPSHALHVPSHAAPPPRLQRSQQPLRRPGADGCDKGRPWALENGLDACVFWCIYPCRRLKEYQKTTKNERTGGRTGEIHTTCIQTVF